MLLLIFGPPAVGKMTVGRAVADASDFRLFHNHMTIEPLLELFGYGTRPFNILRDEFRIRIVEEAAASDVRLVFTFLWPLDDVDDLAVVESYIAPYVDAGKQVAFVELAAPLDTRLERNRTEHRLAHKASKRDVEWSDGNVREAEGLVMNTSPERRTVAEDLLDRHRFLRLDNSALSPAESAAEILTWLSAG
ncbi:AAA family ATPase [Nocardioides sp. InS609-2]|uniref:AAA family ATPase n=1 Tax=Nocardioides sp. InS609-2 TaxID=2760705 RepID=UPI0020BEF298|nr:AAA family ATPase [Nocardioides sp. InS609-2]